MDMSDVLDGISKVSLFCKNKVTTYLPVSFSIDFIVNGVTSSSTISEVVLSGIKAPLAFMNITFVVVGSNVS